MSLDLHPRPADRVARGIRLRAGFGSEHEARPRVRLEADLEGAELAIRRSARRIEALFEEDPVCLPRRGQYGMEQRAVGESSGASRGGEGELPRETVRSGGDVEAQAARRREDEDLLAVHHLAAPPPGPGRLDPRPPANGRPPLSI